MLKLDYLLMTLTCFCSTTSPLELKKNMKQVLHDLFDWFLANKLTVNLEKNMFQHIQK